MQIISLLQATILCDIVVLYVVKKRDVYKSMKYQSVTDEAANVSSATFLSFYVFFLRYLILYIYIL